MNNGIKINLFGSSYRDLHEFLHICDKRSEVSKPLENPWEGLKILFNRSHENGRIISLKWGAKSSGSSQKTVRVPISVAWRESLARD
jgi:hypothetical protein